MHPVIKMLAESENINLFCELCSARMQAASTFAFDHQGRTKLICANCLVNHDGNLSRFAEDYTPPPLDDNTFNLVKLPFTYGIELECIVDPGKMKLSNHVSLKDIILNKKTKREVNRTTDIKRFFIHATDPTVYHMPRLSKGNRCVGAPREYKSVILQGDKGWEKIVEFFDVMHPQFNDTCGMHMHIHPIVPNEPRNDPETYNKYRRQIFWLGNVIDAFVHLPRYPHRMMSGSLSILLASDMSHYRDSLNNLERFSGYSTHATTTSISSKRTMEFRILGGTSHLTDVLRMLNFHMRVVNAGRHPDFEHIKRIITDELYRGNSCYDKVNRICNKCRSYNETGAYSQAHGIISQLSKEEQKLRKMLISIIMGPMFDNIVE